jgi:hypothetical protein
VNARIEGDEGRGVTVEVGGVVAVLLPLLQLAPGADLLLRDAAGDPGELGTAGLIATAPRDIG